MALGFELFSLLDPYITCVLAFLKGIRLLHLIVQCQILFQDFEKKKKKWVHTKRKQLMLLFTMAINVNLSGLGNSLWTPIPGGGGAWDSGAAPRSRTANPRRESNPLGSRSVASTTVYVWGVMKINEAA